MKLLYIFNFAIKYLARKSAITFINNLLFILKNFYYKHLLLLL